MIVSPKLAAVMSTVAAPPPRFTSAPTSTPFCFRVDSPRASPVAITSLVSASTSRNEITTTALSSPVLIFSPPSTRGPTPNPPIVFRLSSRPKVTIVPIRIASAPVIRPSRDCVPCFTRFDAPRSCSAITFLIFARSTIRNLPCSASRLVNIARIPLPMSTCVPKIAATWLCTVP